jgi:hypothetical protein
MSCCHLDGSFIYIENLKGLDSFNIDLEGIFPETQIILLNGLFDDTIDLDGSFIYTTYLRGVYSCIPDATSQDLCFMQLNFSQPCNSAHVVTAGF